MKNLKFYIMQLMKLLSYATADRDFDGLTDADEILVYGTDWSDPNGDIDNDGLIDAVEVEDGLDPSKSSDAGMDFDGDEFKNVQEIKTGMNPNVKSDHPSTRDPNMLAYILVPIIGTPVTSRAVVAEGRIHVL